ncbi:MAG TPA: ubiquinol-cytochrome C chaperone family protein [Allosphingosinicella sp.]
MSFLTRIFGGRREREAYRPLYDRVVNAGRDPAWYLEGQVPDTIDGRFDMIAALLALVLIRLEREEERTRAASVMLTELFIDDMEGTVRQIGIGDLMVGKHVGKMVGALGGRLSAFRSVGAGGDYREVVSRNIFHDAPPSDEAVRFVSERLARFRAALDAAPLNRLLEGELPRP